MVKYGWKIAFIRSLAPVLMHVPKSYVSQAVRSVLVACLLALPVVAVQGWMAYTFPYYTLLTALPNLLFGLLAGLLLVQLRRARPVGRATVPLLSLLYLGWLLITIAEALSYYLQGESFNDRFFAHLDPTNLSTGLDAFPLAIGGAVLAVVLVPVAAGLLLKRYVPRPRSVAGTRHKLIQAIATLALAGPMCVLNSAPSRLAEYLTSYEQSLSLPDNPEAEAVERNLNTHLVPKTRVKAAAAKNVVFIYMESLERTYVDPTVFPGLTPNLAELRREGVDFSGLEAFSGASYTIAGIFASQCGVPLFSTPFAAFDYVGGNNTGKETFHPELACLGDVLHAAGYTQTFLGGAPGSFANKSLFFQLHGYDHVLGKDEIEAEYQGKLPQEGWGLYDDDLFKVAFKHYQALAGQGEPFNLTLLTLDTHPPHGRPSPGCPKYDANPDKELQAVHCTDFLVGRFVAQLKQTPAWKDTVVLVMSDHRSMRSTAAAFYPPDYHRQPLLFVLNAGQGVRTTRMYHMDIAPTLLGMMGVRTNARFLAGVDRGAPGAPDNPLEDGPLVRAVLRKSLWSMNKPVELCRSGALMEAPEQAEFSIGGRPLDWLVLGNPRVALDTERAIAMLVNDRNASLVEVKQSALQPLLQRRPDSSSAIVITPSASVAADGKRFSIDWLGKSGGTAHIATVPRLRGLQISSPRCKELIARADAAQPGTRLDLANEFVAQTLEPHPVLHWPVDIDFRTDASRKVEQELGWFPPSPWGSWTVGSRATLGFALPEAQCQGKVARLTVHPFLPPSRSQLDVDVLVNGKAAARWKFKAPMDTTTVAVPLDVAAQNCKAQITMQFARPGSKGPPYPKGEDPREFQLSVLRFQVGDAVDKRAP